MNLLIDIGNSRVKWGTGEGQGITPGQPLEYDSHIEQNSLLAAWEHLPRPEGIAISSVSSRAIVSQVCSLIQHRWPGVDIKIPHAQSSAFGVQSSYQNPEKLGVDRWLCLLALNQFFSLPACIVDCGTAITIDFLDDRGIHLGGLITPGLTLMKKSLHQEAESLPFYRQSFPVGLADNTGAAIFNGSLFAATGLIEYTLAQQSMQNTLILTGGDAELISKHLSFDSVIEPDLVLQGLSIILEN